MIEEVHVGDIGTAFRVCMYDGNTVVDISTASTLQLIFRKPSGTLLTKTAILTTDGTDGLMEYVTIDDDLNEVGEWYFQGYVVFVSGSWRSNVETFVVYDNIF